MDHFKEKNNPWLYASDLEKFLQITDARIEVNNKGDICFRITNLAHSHRSMTHDDTIFYIEQGAVFDAGNV